MLTNGCMISLFTDLKNRSMKKIEHIKKGTDNNVFDWLLDRPNNGLHGEETGTLFRELIKRHNETADVVNGLIIQRVSHRRELLIAFADEMQNIGFNEMDDVEKVVDIWLKSN